MRGRTRVAFSGVVVAAALVGERAQADEQFRYVDRTGHAHTVSVVLDGASVTPPPAAAMMMMMPPGESAPQGTVSYVEYARQAGELYALAPELVLAVMKVESGFNPRAVSPKGAMGLMQLMPGTASDMGVVDPYDARQSVFGGAHFLRILMDDFHEDLGRALAAYHAGAGRIHRSGGVIPFEITRRYVSSVLRFYGDFIVNGIGQPATSAPSDAMTGSVARTDR